MAENGSSSAISSTFILQKQVVPRFQMLERSTYRLDSPHVAARGHRQRAPSIIQIGKTAPANFDN